MKISELKEIGKCPEWLVLADTLNADVEVNSMGFVIWNGGEFRGGEFRGGEFRGGDFHGGYFLGGEFLGGEFRGGEFLGGYFRGGYFLGGEFHGGYFLGGEFLGGEFRGGYFLGGEFLGGYFRGGVMMPSCKWAYGFTADGKIKIGCKEKTVKEWDAWFASESEAYTTPRNGMAFKRIKACYEAAKSYLLVIGNPTLSDANLMLKEIEAHL